MMYSRRLNQNSVIRWNTSTRNLAVLDLNKKYDALSVDWVNSNSRGMEVEEVPAVDSVISDYGSLQCIAA